MIYTKMQKEPTAIEAAESRAVLNKLKHGYVSCYLKADVRSRETRYYITRNLLGWLRENKAKEE